MILKDRLSGKRTEILNRWFQAILDTYPADTSRFLGTQENPFANPVGHGIKNALENIFDRFIQGAAAEDFEPYLDNIIRMRAVQDFTPSQAASFIFSLKKAVREEFQNRLSPEERDVLDEAVEALALQSFDIFMKCREKLYEIKANELRNMTFRLVQRANMSPGGSEESAGDDMNQSTTNRKR